MEQLKEPETIEEILFYWAERNVMLELLAEGGGAWRVYAMNPDGTEHGGDGDHGCHSDPTFILQVAHWHLRHRGIDRNTRINIPLFPYPVETDRPGVDWYNKGLAGERTRKDELENGFVLDTSDPETKRCLAEIQESIRTGKPVPPRSDS